ncbi:putative ubiquitin-protein ligase e3 component [Phaeomoniella chlamydospora]|uniref:E3 ubiquitin-protein ligase n=1 Tax=Phaeomoniella chlamydospora TaxID=158046 RepID=A0A0G2ET48_PHACM|nr:putative ubiquitin-protein ligase e3 component [Phaeomoniella chlamydospora]
MLELWRIGSEAYNQKIGKHGLDDHGQDDKVWDTRKNVWLGVGRRQIVIDMNENSDDEDEVDPGDNIETEIDAFEEEDDMNMEDVGDGMDIDTEPTEESAPVSENEAATTGRQISPGRSRRVQLPRVRRTSQTSAAAAPDAQPSNDGLGASSDPSVSVNYMNIPKTPAKGSRQISGNLSKHWMTLPRGHQKGGDVPFYEDLAKNIRLDNMILFDLRLWKKTRIDLRDLYISTVVNIPQFKRVLGLRFAGLYTSLASLYLIADREPDHSIINLSLQMLTSQSITDEVIESGNFLTNLMAILYTFLTTRQVGLPKDVNSTATLAFDAGSVNNRRLYHFFTDLRHFLKSEAVQMRVRTQPQYLQQFLDLVKLAQGICPNLRAVGEHVEYETDAWISASLLSREINKLCREFPEAFRVRGPDDLSYLSEALHNTTFTTIVNSVGLERQRFEQTEVKDLVKFKYVVPFDFDFYDTESPESDYRSAGGYRIVDFVVSEGQVSFHHALHYTLSWLLEGSKSMSRDEIRRILLGAAKRFHDVYAEILPVDLIRGPEDALLAMFDFPLRVCAWLAQMKANMWVRNGLSLRHQMSQYKGVQLRDVAYHRDIFLLQTAFVTCEPSRVLASVIDRFGVDDWVRGSFIVKSVYTEDQMVDILEDFVNLLIVILSDRASLVTLEEEPNPHLDAIWRDVIHTLCFKPLSYSDLINRLNERVQDQPEFPKILEQLTNYRAPEGLTDSGMFELKPQYIEHLDPYTTNYTKNQRDEAEHIYKEWMAKKLNKSPADIVPEPKLRPIRKGAFVHLHDFTKTPLFCQIIYFALGYTMEARNATSTIGATRVEALLQVILQLVLIATIEDDALEDNPTSSSEGPSFIQMALTTIARHPLSEKMPTVMSVLQQISLKEEFASAKSKIKHILRIFCRKRPGDFQSVTAYMNLPYDRLDTSSPANIESDAEAKKKQALERQKKVMAQFQQQQQTFMQNQGFADWGDADLSDEEVAMPEATESKLWRYPSGICILCQEETNDSRLYGTFSMLSNSNILRTTELKDPDYVHEALIVPPSLDRAADDIRPFGVAGQNHQLVRVLDTHGQEIIRDRQGLGRGFPKGQTISGPVSTGCGHIMHYACFENYCQATHRRQQNQIARNHPESLNKKEFVCPLCKALGNAFLPIVWKGKEECYPGILAPQKSLVDALRYDIPEKLHTMSDPAQLFNPPELNPFREYVSSIFVPELSDSFDHPVSAVTSPASPQGLPSLIPRLQLPGNLPGRNAIESIVGAPQPPVPPISPTPAKELQKIYARLRETIKANFNPWWALRQSSSDVIQHQFLTLASTYGHSISSVEISSRGSQADGYFLRADRKFIVLMPGPRYRRASYSYLDQPDGLQKAMASLDLAADPLEENIDPVKVHRTRGLAQWLQFQVNRSFQHRGRSAEYFAQSESLSDAEVVLLARLARQYALPFTRKVVVLLHSRYGVEFPSMGLSEIETPELDRLTRLLRLPTVEDVIGVFQYEYAQTAEDEHVRNLAEYWIDEYIDELDKRYGRGHFGLERGHIGKLNIKVPHPGIFELVGLPKFYDVLMEEAQRRKCPTTGKDLTDPSVCLFCGDIFCSQAKCCMGDSRKGGCNQHMEKCSAPIGLFLNIRKCMILVMHGLNGSWLTAPYLTKHGEVDPGLRQRHQLILSQKRYDKLLREVWLNHGICSVISRKLEGDINTGGWETI